MPMPNVACMLFQMPMPNDNFVACMLFQMPMPSDYFVACMLFQMPMPSDNFVACFRYLCRVDSIPHPERYYWLICPLLGHHVHCRLLQLWASILLHVTCAFSSETRLDGWF